jgi:hypothetical protein
LFSVEPSHNPSGTLDAVGADAKRDNAAAALQVDPVEHQRRKPDVLQRPRHQRLQMLAGAADERAARRALARRALRRLHVLADRLARALKAPGADAGEHLLEHDPGQRVAIGEV